MAKSEVKSCVMYVCNASKARSTVFASSLDLPSFFMLLDETLGLGCTRQTSPVPVVYFKMWWRGFAVDCSALVSINVVTLRMPGLVNTWMCDRLGG